MNHLSELVLAIGVALPGQPKPLEKAWYSPHELLAEDSLTWSYDVRTNTWTDLKAKNGPGNPWVGAMDFDPEHNVFDLFSFRDK